MSKKQSQVEVEAQNGEEQAVKRNVSIQITQNEWNLIEAVRAKEFPLGSHSAVVAYGVREWLARRKAAR